MQCNFCHNEITDGGYVWLEKQWCVISHVEPHGGARLPHICNKCSISLSKKEIIQELMKRHPAHKHAVESIIERCKREGYGITFSDQEIDELLGLKQQWSGLIGQVQYFFKWNVVPVKIVFTSSQASGSKCLIREWA